VFLRDVASFVPRVLIDLRDSVLPIARDLAYCHVPAAEFARTAIGQESGQALARRIESRRTNGPGNARAVALSLEEALAALRRRNHLEDNWVDDRARKTLDTWLPLNEWSPRLLTEQERAVRGLPAGAGVGSLSWWSPYHLGSEEAIDVIGAADRIGALGPGPEKRRAYELLGELLEQEEAREAARSRSRREVAHFRWLALWQCDPEMSYAAVAKDEEAWSSETLRLLAGSLTDARPWPLDSGDKMTAEQVVAVLPNPSPALIERATKMKAPIMAPIPGRRTEALRILLARGEPYLQGAYPRGLWPELFGANEDGLRKLGEKLSRFGIEVRDGTVQQGIRRSAEKIGLTRR
jgi:hypothetical protein